MTPHHPTRPVRTAAAVALAALALAGCGTGTPDAADVGERLSSGVDDARAAVQQAAEDAGDAPGVQDAVATTRDALTQARTALEGDLDAGRLAEARGSLDEAARTIDRVADDAGGTAGAVLDRLREQIEKLSADLEDAAAQVR